MNAINLLKCESDLAYQEVLEAIEGVDESLAWAALPAAGDDYLHTDGSIHGLVLHIAVGKFIYGSVGFRQSEVRWRDAAERIASFEPNWKAAVDFLKESHEYWRSTWDALSEGDLDASVPHFRGDLRPAWKMIRTVTSHDSYHAGQIALVRYAVKPTFEHPASAAEDIRTSCRGPAFLVTLKLLAYRNAC